MPRSVPPLIFAVQSAVLAAVLAAGCATAPHEELVDSRATVRVAETLGAEASPPARYHLALAREQIEAAEPLVDGSNADRETARRVLARAKVDAELALALARSEDARVEARDAWTEVHQLQSLR